MGQYFQHGFLSDDHHLAFKQQESQICEGIMAPVFFTHKQAEKLKEWVESGDPTKLAAANKHIAIAAAVTTALRFGYVPDEMLQQKSINQGVGNHLPKVIQTYLSFGREDLLDMNWMRIFETQPLTDVLLASIWEIQNCIEWHDLDSDTSSIPESNIVEGVWTTFRPKYKGVKVNLSRTLLAKDPFGYLTFVVQGFRYSGELKKTRDAYTMLAYLIDLANTAGYVTSFTTNLRETINQAALTLRVRNSGKGYAMNENTPLLSIANERLMGGMEANFVMTNTVQFPTVVAQYPIERMYTLNLPVDMNVSGVMGALVLPGRQNLFGIFDNYSTEQFQKPENNALCVIGRMAYNFVGDETQIQLFRFQ